MAYDPGALEAALAAAVGDTSTLIDELRAVFLDSATGYLASMQIAEDAAAWQGAAQRLTSLAASFGAVRVIDAARAAGAASPGDARALTRIDRALAALRPA